jgi:hypothetical protein
MKGQEGVRERRGRGKKGKSLGGRENRQSGVVTETDDMAQFILKAAQIGRFGSRISNSRRTTQLIHYRVRNLSNSIQPVNGRRIIFIFQTTKNQLKLMQRQ